MLTPLSWCVSAKIKDDWHEQDAEPRCERCLFSPLGHWLLDPPRDFHGPLRAQVPGLVSTSPILSQAPSALMSRVASSRPKGRAGTGREPEGSRPWSPAATPPELQVLQPGLWAAPGQGQVGRQSHSMPGWSWKPQGLVHFRSAQAGQLAAPSLRTKGRDFERGPTRGPRRRETQNSPFPSLPQTLSSLALEIK